MNSNLLISLGLVTLLMLFITQAECHKGGHGGGPGKYLKEECGATDDQMKEMWMKMQEQSKQLVTEMFGEECAAKMPKRGKGGPPPPE